MSEYRSRTIPESEESRATSASPSGLQRKTTGEIQAGSSGRTQTEIQEQLLRAIQSVGEFCEFAKKTPEAQQPRSNDVLFGECIASQMETIKDKNGSIKPTLRAKIMQLVTDAQLKDLDAS